MNNPWTSFFTTPTFITSNKDYKYPIFGYVITQKYTKKQRDENYKRYLRIIKKQDNKLKKYRGADER